MTCLPGEAGQKEEGHFAWESFPLRTKDVTKTLRFIFFPLSASKHQQNT
jgi:hypothetical protein